MSDPLGRLFFPLANLNFPNAFSAGAASLDLQVARTAGKYSSVISKGKSPLKLSLEKIDQHEFTQVLMQYYFFRQSEKEYGSPRQFLARLGFHKKTPLEMEYADQKYVLSFKVQHDGKPLELQLFYSPVLGQVLVRANRRIPA